MSVVMNLTVRPFESRRLMLAARRFLLGVIAEDGIESFGELSLNINIFEYCEGRPLLMIVEATAFARKYYYWDSGSFGLGF